MNRREMLRASRKAAYAVCRTVLWSTHDIAKVEKQRHSRDAERIEPKTKAKKKLVALFVCMCHP